MKTYLFTWNPDRWSWDDIKSYIAQIKNKGFAERQWSSGSTKKIEPGDRVFLMKLGKQAPRGIIGSAKATSEVFQDNHWSGEPKLANYVKLHFDTILNPNEDSILPIEVLQNKIYPTINWTPQASGMSISDDVASQLEKFWAPFLNRPSLVRQIDYPDEIDETKTYQEGATKQVSVNMYERNAEARAACIRIFGIICSVCGFDFERKYGEIGSGYIHVHHLKPLSEIRNDYQINPQNDLRPVCPNCHAIIHQKKPEPYTIEELKAILEIKELCK